MFFSLKANIRINSFQAMHHTFLVGQFRIYCIHSIQKYQNQWTSEFTCMTEFHSEKVSLDSKNMKGIPGQHRQKRVGLMLLQTSIIRSTSYNMVSFFEVLYEHFLYCKQCCLILFTFRKYGTVVRQPEVECTAQLRTLYSALLEVNKKSGEIFCLYEGWGAAEIAQLEIIRKQI